MSIIGAGWIVERVRVAGKRILSPQLLFPLSTNWIATLASPSLARKLIVSFRRLVRPSDGRGVTVLAEHAPQLACVRRKDGSTLCPRP